MKSKNQGSLEALQPFLVYIGMYLMSLSLAVYICFSIVSAFQPDKGETGKQQFAQAEGQSTKSSR